MSLTDRKSLYWITPLLMLFAVVVLFFLMHPSQTPAPQPNVILITMDSLRHDDLGCTGQERAHTPNIDALARDGVVFRECVAQGTFTRISVPSMITGMFPLFTQIRTFSGHLDSVHTTVAEVLEDDGYLNLATNRMWSKSFYQGFQETGGSGEQTPQRTARAIQGIEDRREGKFFIWLYYWDPHAPYLPPEEIMRRYEPDYIHRAPREQGQGPRGTTLRDASGHFGGSIGTLKALNQKEIRLTSLDRRHLKDLYLAEIAYVDEGIGEVVARLKELDLYDESLIILNSDHGEGFGEHGFWYHGSTVFDEMCLVPLIIKPPRSRDVNKQVWGVVRNIDVVPTILDYCGLEVPATWDGQSLRPFIETERTPDLPGVTETQVGKKSHLMALRQGGHKLIYDIQNDKVWLYDLQADPGETNSILPDSTLAGLESAGNRSAALAIELEEELRADLLDALRSEDLADLRPTMKDLGPIDNQTKERLKALGYVY
jgi:arylsulfatase A-like enzyme